MLESQEEGTLLSILKSKLWCNTLVSGKLTIAKDIISFFNIAIHLNEEGLQNIDQIITLVFQCIATLKKKGPLKTVFDVINNIKLKEYIEEPPRSSKKVSNKSSID